VLLPPKRIPSRDVFAIQRCHASWLVFLQESAGPVSKKWPAAQQLADTVSSPRGERFINGPGSAPFGKLFRKILGRATEFGNEESGLASFFWLIAREFFGSFSVFKLRVQISPERRLIAGINWDRHRFFATSEPTIAFESGCGSSSL